jgi:hypothetical protein
MWDYVLNENNDLSIDSKGDIAMVGGYGESDEEPYQVISQDIRLALYMYSMFYTFIDDPNIIEDITKSILEVETRIDTLNIKVDDDGKMTIEFTLKGE